MNFRDGKDWPGVLEDLGHCQQPTPNLPDPPPEKQKLADFTAGKTETLGLTARKIEMG